jgi:Flp pilus assembly protein TadB
MSENGAATAGLIALAIVLVGLAWVVVTAWYILMYVVFGLLFIPYRLIRRGNRKRKMENLRHREQLEMQKETQEALRQR